MKTVSTRTAEQKKEHRDGEGAGKGGDKCAVEGGNGTVELGESFRVKLLPQFTRPTTTDL